MADCICIEDPMIGRFGPAKWGESCPRHGNGQLTRGMAGCKCRSVDYWNLDVTGCPKHDVAAAGLGQPQ